MVIFLDVGTIEGSDLFAICSDSIALARQLGIGVRFRYSKATILVEGNSNPYLIEAQVKEKIDESKTMESSDA